MDEPGPETGGAGATIAGLALVWIAGVILSYLTLIGAISGRFWDLRFPSWLIALLLMVGIWQWLWLAPMLLRARRAQHLAWYRGLLTGGITFSVVQIVFYAIVFFFFRRVSLQ